MKIYFIPQSNSISLGTNPSEFQLITAFKEHGNNAALSSSRTSQLAMLSSLQFLFGVGTGAKRNGSPTRQRREAAGSCAILGHGEAQKLHKEKNCVHTILQPGNLCAGAGRH